VNIPVVYEDEWLLVVDKPAGLLTIPTPKNERRTLTGLLNEELKNKNIPYRLHPCHRLDRETSGLIIYAKGKSIQQGMMDLFKRRGIRKTYIAFVQGVLPKREGRINMPIEGRSAATDYCVIEQRKDFAITEVMPSTGRTNQIRIHFKNIGHPIVGEARFAFRKDYRLKAKRLCLHAKGLEFMHPVSKQSIGLDAQLPQDLESFLAAHRQ